MSGLEWCVFVCTHTYGSQWKNEFDKAPWWAKKIMAHGKNMPFLDLLCIDPVYKGSRRCMVLLQLLDFLCFLYGFMECNMDFIVHFPPGST